MDVRVDPLTHLRPIRGDELDALSAEHEVGPGGPLAYDVYRAGGELVIEFDVPGVEPSQIEVDLQGRTLRVTVTRQLPASVGADLIDTGRQHGTFTQRLFLGNRWDIAHLRATTRNGVLYLRAPVSIDVARHRIPVMDERAVPRAEALEHRAAVAVPTENGHADVEVVRHSAA
ncbi:MAG: Hsp20/alpha crystallin family protein [Actinomycetota bacterium]|nr:Hsp20/alpha crystallin family protein [Actinomycetota bacterium]